jgi:hypothetical protein
VPGKHSCLTRKNPHSHSSFQLRQRNSALFSCTEEMFRPASVRTKNTTCSVLLGTQSEASQSKPVHTLGHAQEFLLIIVLRM